MPLICIRLSVSDSTATNLIALICLVTLLMVIMLLGSMFSPFSGLASLDTSVTLTPALLVICNRKENRWDPGITGGTSGQNIKWQSIKKVKTYYEPPLLSPGSLASSALTNIAAAFARKTSYQYFVIGLPPAICRRYPFFSHRRNKFLPDKTFLEIVIVNGKCYDVTVT